MRTGKITLFLITQHQHTRQPCTFFARHSSLRTHHLVLEVAILTIKPGQTEAFEAAFREAAGIIAAAGGYLGHELQRCVENDHQYILLVRWQTLEDHTVGFRGSESYQDWKRLLHHFYDPFPTVEHYTTIG